VRDHPAQVNLATGSSCARSCQVSKCDARDPRKVTPFLLMYLATSIRIGSRDGDGDDGTLPPHGFQDQAEAGRAAETSKPTSTPPRSANLDRMNPVTSSFGAKAWH